MHAYRHVWLWWMDGAGPLYMHARIHLWSITPIPQQPPTAGIGLGLTSLVAAPVVGASSHGAKGFFAGLGAGLAGAVVLPVAGVVGGVTCAIGTSCVLMDR